MTPPKLPRPITWKRYGPHAVLFQFADQPSADAYQYSRAIAEVMEHSQSAHVAEFIPSLTTALIEFVTDDNTLLEETARELAAQFETARHKELPPAPIIEVPIRYDGPDLARVASLNQLEIDEVELLHADTIYQVCALGFSPGFPYLVGLNPRLHTPRLDMPRPRIVPGSVGIGGQHTGIYTVESPGGWNIIGHTTRCIFNPTLASSDHPETAFALKPGDQLIFVPE